MSTPRREEIVAWVVSAIMPHEAAVRGWLRRRLQSPEDIDDLIQEAYAKLAALTSLDHVERGDRYFFRIVRNLLVDKIRHARVVRIDSVADIDLMNLDTAEPGPDRITAARQELAKVAALIDALPDRYRQVVRMRRVEGLSQKEIARRLNVTESVVENDAVRGLRLVIKALKGGDAADAKSDVQGGRHASNR